MHSDAKISEECDLLIESNTEYVSLINSIQSISFDKIRQIAVNNSGKYRLNNRGTEIINKEVDLFTYLKSYGSMHKAKITSALEPPFPQSFSKPITIIDWGCGQGLASLVFMEKIRTINIDQVILIEPSEIAIKRAALHCKSFNAQMRIITLNKRLDSLLADDFNQLKGNCIIHLFSNILDIDDYSVNHLISLLEHVKRENNYYVCVSPHIDELKTAKIERFHQYFKHCDKYECIHEKSNTKYGDYWLCNNAYKYKRVSHGSFDCGYNIDHNGCERKWTRELRVFRVQK